jgi:putative ABC transport system substrate-binding protein
MRRREFISIIGSAAAFSLPVRAQQANIKRIGYVMGIGEGPGSRLRFQAFRQRLATLGWVEGRNIEIIARFGAADPIHNRSHVAEMLRLTPDLIVTGNSTTVVALMKETNTIPIVLANMTDPVAQGFVASLSRPGGNVTGFANFEPATAAKWLELLREVVPSILHVGVLLERGSHSAPIYARAIEAAAPSIRIQVTQIAVGKMRRSSGQSSRSHNDLIADLLYLQALSCQPNDL